MTLGDVFLLPTQCIAIRSGTRWVMIRYDTILSMAQFKDLSTPGAAWVDVATMMMDDIIIGQAICIPFRLGGRSLIVPSIILAVACATPLDALQMFYRHYRSHIPPSVPDQSNAEIDAMRIP